MLEFQPAILTLALLGLPCAPPAAAPRADCLGGMVQGSAQEAPPSPEPDEWAGKLERDRRTSFNAHSAQLALEALTAGLDPTLRPVALFALGASGERSMTPRLESWAVEGTAADRRAAVLGLAEGGFASVEFLTRLAGSSLDEVREAALLSLARKQGAEAAAALDRLSGNDAPDPVTAGLARKFATDPLSGADFAAAREFVELRWDAARRYGLVDDQPWRAHLLAELGGDPEFLSALVYGAASDLHRVGTADHFLEIALAEGPASRMRAVVNSIPSELDRMIQSGVWYPRNQEEWAQLLYEIDDRRLEGLTVELLRQARAFPDLSAHAAVLMVRAGNFEGLSMLELDIASSDPRKRQRIAETLGGTREAHYVDLLETLRTDENIDVRAAAAIAQMRLGHVLSADAVRIRLTGEFTAERAALVDGLARLAYLPEIASLLLEHCRGFSSDERLSAAIELGRNGEAREAGTLQAALSAEILRSSRGAHYVHALVRIGGNAEMQSLFSMFPLEDAREVNVVIARAMCARRDPAVLTLLRTALWQRPFDRSVLAAALMQHVSGLDSLRMELERPPRGARPEDIRRVGYALGQWGGTPEVERLGRRRTAADPALQGALLGALGARTH